MLSRDSTLEGCCLDRGSHALDDGGIENAGHNKVGGQLAR